VTAKGIAFGVVLLALVAGAGWWSGRASAGRDAAVAKQAAIADSAEKRADSLATALRRADSVARQDSGLASAARAKASQAEAIAAAAVAANRTLRHRLELIGDTAVIVDSGVAVLIPPAVAAQLRSDDSTITALGLALYASDSALEATVRLAADYKAGRDTAEAEVASLRTANAALHAQVKLLAPPKCGHVCSGLVGAGAVVLAGYGIRKL
jgi:hypothetical protein